MTLFFILLVAVVVFSYITDRSFRQAHPQFSKMRAQRIDTVPFFLAIWVLIVALSAYTLSALTDMIGELFKVDNYINLFGGGWIGIVLRFLRSNGFIGDIQEPMVLMQYRGTIALIYKVSIISCVVCGVALYGFWRQVKNSKPNATVFLSSYYLSLACGVLSFALIMWGLYGFDEVIDHTLQDMNDIVIDYFIVFAVVFLYALIVRFLDVRKFLAQTQCEVMTWQQLSASLKIKTEKGQKTIEEWQIACITIGLALLTSGAVILSTLPVSAEPEQNEATYSGGEEIATPPAAEQSVVNHDEEDCIAILQKYYTASNAQIQEWGGKEAFETARFIKYTSCWDSQVLTSNQDFGIGDDCLRVGSIVPNSKLSNSYIVSVSCGYSEEIPTCVVMAIDGGQWKIDNISMPPYNNALIDYSRPASDYYAYPDCGGDVVEEPEAEAAIEEDIAPLHEEEDNNIYPVAETMPMFPGGQQALVKYLSENVQYPPQAKENGIQGRVVCQFVVEKDGSISNVTVARSGGDPSLDNEAVRVIQSMPKWTPGQDKGKLVRVKFAIPLNFNMN